MEREPRQRPLGAGRRRATPEATRRATRANGKSPFQLGSHDGNSASPLFPSMSPGARAFPSHPQPLPLTGLYGSDSGYTSARVGCCTPCSALRLRRRYHCYTGSRCRRRRHLHTTTAPLPRFSAAAAAACLSPDSVPFLARILCLSQQGCRRRHPHREQVQAPWEPVHRARAARVPADVRKPYANLGPKFWGKKEAKARQASGTERPGTTAQPGQH